MADFGERQEVIEETVVIESTLVFRVAVARQQLEIKSLRDRVVNGQRYAIRLVRDLDLVHLAGVVVVVIGGRVGIAVASVVDRAVWTSCRIRCSGPARR